MAMIVSTQQERPFMFYPRLISWLFTGAIMLAAGCATTQLLPPAPTTSPPTQTPVSVMQPTVTSPVQSAPPQTKLATPQMSEDVFKKDITQWRAARLQDLTKEDGWLSVAGLYWLKPGSNSAGSGPNNTVIFPRGKSPELAGNFVMNNSGGEAKVVFNPAPGAGVTLDGKQMNTSIPMTIAENKATVLKLNSLNFYLIKRGDLIGVRIKDSASDARTKFKGLAYFDPPSPTWRVEAKLLPHNKKIPITNIIGLTSDEPSPGALVFNVNGQTYKLDAIGDTNASELDVMFADATSGRDTYGAGRYLDAVKSRSQPDVYILDFNKAYSPPCSFTRFATCPLPPAQNRLPLAVTAGEKSYAAH
jgi:uncharacterized protein